MTTQVPVAPLPMAELEPVIGAQRQADLLAASAAARQCIAGRALVHVNSTANGGGVAEMLPTLLGYARGAGVDARWHVLIGDPAFFAVTKRLHNRLHGRPGDGGPLGPDEQRSYDSTLARNGRVLLDTLKPGDIAVLHDPQTLGLAPMLQRAGVKTVWRCHIGLDRSTAATEEAWGFLSPYLAAVDGFVFSRSDYRPDAVPEARTWVITPSLDPLSAKNRPMPDSEVLAVLGYAGLVQSPLPEPPHFARRDGTTARMERRADLIQLGPAAPLDEPLIVQVSRWDRLKDMPGVMRGFADHVATTGSGHLILAGPNVSAVSDDPEGAIELSGCIEMWRALPNAQRERIHLACLPDADVEENAVIVNALQRHAAVVVQKSLEEGFGLTVLEAMWKGRPVVASAVGGIRDQVVDGVSGLLVPDATDLADFGLTVRRVLDDPDLAASLGAAAAQRASGFLPDLHLVKWANLVSIIATG